MSSNVASRRSLRYRSPFALPSHSSSPLPSRSSSSIPSRHASSASPDIWLALAQEDSSTSAKVSSTSAKVSSAPAPAAYGADSTVLDTQRVLAASRLVGLRAQARLARRNVGHPEASSHPPLPRARPSQTGSPSDYRGSAVPAATRVSTRGRSPKPVIKSILKPSTSTPIASELVSACAGPIDLSGEGGICGASAEVYAAPWRSFPAQEWANDKLPIERLDRCAVRRRQIEKRRLLAGGAPSRKARFEQDPVAGCRIVSRWIEDRR